MATLVQNVSSGTYTLPPTYGSKALAPGFGVVIADTPANVTAVLQPTTNPSILNISQVPDGQAGAIIPTSSGGGGTAGAAHLFEIDSPAAASTTLVSSAGLAANSASNAFAIAANPDVPRNVQVTFGSGWDGGNVTVSGTNAQNATISETIVASSGATVAGAKAFKTVTSASKAAVGASSATATIGVGNSLGVASQLAASIAIVFANNVAGSATIDSTNNTFNPSEAPNGSTSYALVVNL